MRFRRKDKLLGIIILAIGVGILSVIIIPTIGWVVFAGIVLICIGAYLLKRC